MKIEHFQLTSKISTPLVITVDRSLKQPDRCGYTYGNLNNRTYCREVNVGPATYDLLREVEFLMFTLSGGDGTKKCLEIFDHFSRVDRVDGKSAFNDFLCLEDLREIFKRREQLPSELKGKRFFGWQSLMYPPRLHPANPALFVPYLDPDVPDRLVEYRKRHSEWFWEGNWYPYDDHFWRSDTFLSPRFRVNA